MPDPTSDSISFWRSALLSGLPDVVHGVTERGGGVSEPPYASLNVGLHVGDAPDRVRKNRGRVAAAAVCEPSRMVCAAQVHGAEVAVVGEADAGRGAAAAEDAIPGADGLVTGTPGLLLTLFFADCLPVLLADPGRRVVAVAHAGWRGLVGGVIENTLRAMAEVAGSRPGDVFAAVGPGIGPCCFAVGAEVAAQFPPGRVTTEPSGKPYVDLPGAAADRLAAAGVAADRVEVCGDCTACRTDRFFSHRRENGRTGRMGAFIALRKD